MSQIQKRMEALGVKQVDMILELRKRGISVSTMWIAAKYTRTTESRRFTFA